MTRDRTQRAPLSFTLGDASVPIDPQIVTHGSFVYVRTGDSSQSATPYWSLEDEAYTARSDVWYSADGSKTVPGSQLYWMVKNVDPSLTSIGQPIHFGDSIYLFIRYIPSLKHWLPGKLVPNPAELSSTIYLSATADQDYDNANVGAWTIEQ